MKRIYKVLIGTVFIVCCLSGLGYLGLASYYENGFSFMTYINGVYCTGKSVETVNAELNEAYDYEGLTVNLKENSFHIAAKEISYTYDYSEPLNHYLSEQNPYLWIENLTQGKKEYTLQPAVSFNREYLDAILNLELSEKNPSDKIEVSLLFGDDGFYLSDNKRGLLDISKAKTVIEESLMQGNHDIDLEEAGCYYDEPYTDYEIQLLDFCELVDRYQSRKVSYIFDDGTLDFGSSELAKTLSLYTGYQKNEINSGRAAFSQFISEDGTLLVDEEAVSNLLNQLFEPYNTYRNHSFTTHDGRELNIKGGTYGNKIAMDTETKELVEFLSSEKETYRRTPEYTKEAPIKAKNDIGNTYIEVDIGQQKMFYYRDGELFIETDVVTGKNNATREEVCYVYAKQKNRILRGADYETFVYYWMPVSGGIGIHDATWRSKFGGDIYLRDGSHGCVNTPIDIVKQMYEVVEVGTPCILYYGLD